jgi:hypothetical protein
LKIPSQSLLQRWLRERKILVEVKPVDDWNEWFAQVYGEDCMSPFFLAKTTELYKTYEEALEDGLKSALSIL